MYLKRGSMVGVLIVVVGELSSEWARWDCRRAETADAPIRGEPVRGKQCQPHAAPCCIAGQTVHGCDPRHDKYLTQNLGHRTHAREILSAPWLGRMGYQWFAETRWITRGGGHSIQFEVDEGKGARTRPGRPRRPPRGRGIRRVVRPEDLLTMTTLVYKNESRERH